MKFKNMVFALILFGTVASCSKDKTNDEIVPKKTCLYT